MSNLIVYKASAGSGKTFRLAAEYIKLVINDPLSYKRILAVTFTNKATAEMKGRILEELKKIADGDESPMFALICEETRLKPDMVKARATKALSNILHDYSRFSISTIDSFVQRIIQALLWEIGQQGAGDIRLDFNPVLERAADIMLDESVDDPGLFQWLQSMGETQLESGKSWDIRGGLIALGKELFSESFRLMNPDEIKQFADKGKINSLKNELNVIIGNVSKQIIELGKDAIRDAYNLGFDEKSFTFGSSGVYGFFEKCADHSFGESLPNSNASRVVKALESSDTEGWVKSEDRKKNPNIAQLSDLISSKLKPSLAKLCDVIQSNEVLYNSSRFVLQNLDSLAILSDLWLTIRNLSNEEGFMLLADSGPLLREFVKETDAPFLYEKVGTRFDSFMIDEFQDTSVIQWQNFKPLVENSLAQGNFSMVVGDIKQAIYRWRNGDWRILSSGLEDDFASLGVNYKSLDINRRSLPAIVEFNNLFFTKASKVLKELFEESVKDSEVDASFSDEIPHAYESVIQKTSKTDQGTGFVEFTYIPNEDKKFKENLGNYLPNLISDIQKRGYKAGDIAILVRSNKDGQDLANMLLSYKQTNPDKFGSFDVVSQEGLLLVSSNAIRLCVAAIRTTFQPNDSITRACLAAGLKSIDGFKEFSINELIAGDTLYAEVEWLKGFRTRPVQEVFEAILKRYGLWQSKKELAYISELHEQIINLSRKGPNDVGRFLEWWDEDGIKLALTMPDSENAITITTIHKSKGLQFPVVIVPHGDWPFRQKGKKSLLWVNSDLKPFDCLPKYPIYSSKESSKNYFTTPIAEEEMQNLVDNLNLLYVAFTRAENELYVYCPAMKESNTVSSTSPLIKRVLTAISPSGLTNFTEIDDSGNSVDRYRLGNREAFESKNKFSKGGTTSWMIERYPAGETRANVKQHLESTDFFSTSTASPSVSINYGKMMHNLFSRIKYSSDIDNALASMQFEGLIDLIQKAELKDKIHHLLKQQPYSNWFAEEWEVKNESSVLTPEGYTYRPDRVMIKDGNVIIIDYKFGAESESYSKQIQRYSTLLQKMGYASVDGYLWYVDSEKLVKC
jgi:ATP-dependent helicase/nuclease subunit A